MVDRIHIKKQNIRVEYNIIHLWKYFSALTKKEQKIRAINVNATRLHVLRALRLKPEHLVIVKKKIHQKSFTALQVRTESDWVAYSSIRNTTTHGESILVT